MRAGSENLKTFQDEVLNYERGVKVFHTIPKFIKKTFDTIFFEPKFRKLGVKILHNFPNWHRGFPGRLGNF